MDLVYNNGCKVINLISMANGMLGRLIMISFIWFVTCGTCSFFFSTELFLVMYETTEHYLDLLYNISQLFLFVISITVIYYLSSIGQDLVTSYRLEPLIDVHVP